MTAPQRSWPAATLLGRVRPTTRDELLNLGVPRRYGGGRKIISEGDTSQHTVLIVNGVVKVIGSTMAGAEALLDIRVGGDLVGELAAMDGGPRSASVITCGEVGARIISRVELTAFMTHHPEATVDLGAIIGQRLRWANRRRLDFVAHDATTRIGRLLIEIATTYGNPTSLGWTLGIHITQAELGSIAGVARATAEKALQSFEAAGCIRRGYRRVDIVDMDGLRRSCDLVDE